MDVGNQEDHDDPQFMKLLETCLKIEIAEAKKTIDANTRKIGEQKTVIRNELDKRKRLKVKVVQMDKITAILNETLTKLNMNIDEISETLEMMKANIDNQHKVNQIMMQEYQNIIVEYKETWQNYRAMYEKFPLAKTRNAAKINLQKLKIEYMVMDYKKTEMTEIIKQRLHIDWIRIRCKIIEFANVMREQLKLKKKLMNLKANINYHGRELQSIEMELQMLHKKEEDQRKLRKQKILDMGPPKMNHIQYQEKYPSNQVRSKMHWERETFDDNISVNTMILEELCINEKSAESSEIIDVEAIHDDDFKCPAFQVQKKSSNLKNTEKSDNETSIALITAGPEDPENPPLSKQSSFQARIETADNDINIQIEPEINIEEARYKVGTPKSQETVKTQASYCTSKKSFKHTIINNEEDDICAKRSRFPKENEKESSNAIITPRPLDIVKEVDSKSSSSIPKIVNVETVHYNITPISKSVRRPSILSSGMFSPVHLECCDSISSFNQDFMSKGPSSLYEGSLCNYKLSPTTSDISTTHDKDLQMVSSSKYTLQQNQDQSNDNVKSSFSLNFVKPKIGNLNLF